MFKKEAVIVFLVALIALIFYPDDVSALTCSDVGYCSGLSQDSQGSSTARDSQGNIYCYYKTPVVASGCAGRTCWEGTKVICNSPNRCTAAGCQGECKPNWQCSGWSSCKFDGTQSRNCNDVNNCGTTSGRPELWQSCSPGQPTPTPSPTPTPAPSQPATKPTAPTATGGTTQNPRVYGRLVDACYEQSYGSGADCSRKQDAANEYCKRTVGGVSKATSFSEGSGADYRGGTIYLPSERECRDCGAYFTSITCSSAAPPVQQAKKGTVTLAKISTPSITYPCEGIYDLDNNGKVDTEDFFIFVQRYERKDNSVDYTKDGIIDDNDRLCFQDEGFGKVEPVTQDKCFKANQNGEIDPDYNHDGRVDDMDVLVLFRCDVFFRTVYKPYPGQEICKKFDFDNNGNIDVNTADGACFGLFYKQDFGCDSKRACSDADKSGAVDFDDFLEFASCYGSTGGSGCVKKFDYGGNDRVDAGDFICFRKDFGKSFGEVCSATKCFNDNECGGAGNYCSFGPKGFRAGQGAQGNCCPNEQYWDQAIGSCRGSADIGEACKCPFEQRAVTGEFYDPLDPNRKVTSTEFIKNSACWAFSKACVATKRLSRNVEKRKLEVEKRGK